MWGTEEGKIQAPPSLVQEGLKAAPSSGVHAHTAESSPKTACPGGCMHALQVITLCTSDCKNKDQLIIISPCQVSKYYYPHLTGKLSHQAITERAGAHARTTKQVSKLSSLLSPCFSQATKLISDRVRLELAPLEQGKAAASLFWCPMDHRGQQDPALCQEDVAFPNFWLLITCSLFVESNWSLKKPHAVVLGASGCFYSSRYKK